MKRRNFLSMGAGTILLSSIGVGAADVPLRRKVGLVYDALFLEHWLQTDHPESPSRYQAIIDGFKKEDLLRKVSRLELLPEVESEVLAIHTEDHVAQIKQRYGHSHQVALGAVGAVLAGVQAVCEGRQKHVFCVTRPPGHHALNTGKEEGFCLYNHVAIAARYAQKVYKRRKILIVDWDYHHGNGTEAAFYTDPSVLFFSTHDYRAYPGTGDPARVGAGKGKGYNINVHLDCGAGDQDIIAAFHDKLAPAVKQFKPDLILVSAGFDSRKDDLLGCFDVTDNGFAQLTRIVQGFADEYCDGCLVSLLEGGYTLSGLSSAAVAHLEALLEIT